MTTPKKLTAAEIAAKLAAVEALADELDPPTGTGKPPRLETIYGRRIRAALEARPESAAP